MKKRKTTALKLRKNLISNLENNEIKGGTKQTVGACTSFIDACPSAWVCPTDPILECP